MKASLTALSFFPFALFAFGCSGFGDPNDAEQHPDTPAPVRANEPAAPAAPPLEGTPVTSDLTEALGVFVVATAAPGGDGTRAHPFATITDAIDSAKKVGKRVYVCEGTYRESIVIAGGISMVGGLDCSVATWTVGKGRSRIEATSIPAVTASNLSAATRFAGFEVIAPDAKTPGASSIALFATASSLLTIDNARFVAGNGAKGTDGVEPAATIVTGTPDGEAGMSARNYCWWSGDSQCYYQTGLVAQPGGSGGSIKCNGVASGRGGVGGSGGVYVSTLLAGQTQWTWSPMKNRAYTAGAPASAPATDGLNAASSQGGSFTRDGWVAGDGSNGTDGSVGMNGAGGSGFTPTTYLDHEEYWYGHHGSGGGAGGCGGVAGTHGTGGGASVAAYVVDSAITFIHSELESKNGGDGGKGTFGSAATAGGKGGPLVGGVAGTNGQDGTAGGAAGVSGSGAGGSSVAIVTFGAKANLESTKLTIGKGGSGVAAMMNGTKTIAASANGKASEVVDVAQ